MDEKNKWCLIGGIHTTLHFMNSETLFLSGLFDHPYTILMVKWKFDSFI